MFASFSDYLPIRTWLAQSRRVLPRPTGSLAGKTLLITGASGAIVSIAARILLDELDAAQLIFAVPDIPEGPDGAPALAALPGLRDCAHLSQITVWHLDLLSFASVRHLAARAAALDRLDGALMGAALITTDRAVGPDGWDAALQVNHLACALLELLLLPALARSAARHGAPAVLSAVSSLSVRPGALGLPTTAATTTTLLRAVDGVVGYAARRQQYGVAKLLHLFFVRELAARARGRGVLVRACDFGVSGGVTGVATVNWEARLFSSVFGRSPEMCARVVANACVAREDEHGAILVDYEPGEYVTALLGFSDGVMVLETR